MPRRQIVALGPDADFGQHDRWRGRGLAHAYASWQKGGIENANGRLRRWLPRHLDMDRTSDQEIQEIVLTTNLTPRKCLGFKTPFQASIAELGKDVQIRFGGGGAGEGRSKKHEAGISAARFLSSCGAATTVPIGSQFSTSDHRPRGGFGRR